ncbi:MAG: winged helix-turn-helix transcriptional regulator [Ruminococcaceae bacterium]|jgi:ArsR family transcriptional regulator|nr:winged helix-turn-helix transcriptional regulator [Oscillospiraceae bacterium]
MLNFSDAVLIFKAMSDETRLKIIDMLSCDELCACAILEAFEITQPTLSYHMRILTESGLVLARKDGPWTRYTLNPELIESVKLFLETITTDKEDCICKG